MNSQRGALASVRCVCYICYIHTYIYMCIYIYIHIDMGMHMDMGMDVEV